MTEAPQNSAKFDSPTVYFDGTCPLCRREIAFYKRRKGADQVCWIDITEVEDGEFGPGLDRDAALKRFHVRQADSTLLSGGAAFAALWAALPRLRFLGLVFQLPVLRTVIEIGYRGFLSVRPALQKLVVKTES